MQPVRVCVDALDPGITLFLREKMAEGNARFTAENVVLLPHGATAPSTCDFCAYLADCYPATGLAQALEVPDLFAAARSGPAPVRFSRSRERARFSLHATC
jgi:hypothetical protein